MSVPREPITVDDVDDVCTGRGIAGELTAMQTLTGNGRRRC